VLSKRDLQLVRLGVRWKWLDAEQGEDILFLKRKFGDKLTIEEIIRRRGYLGDEEIDQLAESANQSVGRRDRPKLQGKSLRSAPVAPSRMDSMPADKTIAEVPAHLLLGEESQATRARDFDKRTQAVRAYDRDADRETEAHVPVHSERPPLVRSEPPALVDPAEFSPDSAATVVAPIPEGLRDLIARSKERKERAPEEEQEHTIIGEPAHIQELRRRQQFENEEATTEWKEGDLASLQRARLEAKRRREQADRTTYDKPADPRARTGSSAETAFRPRRVALRSIFDGGAPADGTIDDSASTLPPLETEEPDRGGDLAPGEFGPYYLSRVIARGSRGNMYLAEAPDGTQVALKVLDMSDERARASWMRLKERLRKVAMIDSPHVVRALDFGTIDDQAFVALQYVDAWTLEERIDSGDRPQLLEALKIAQDIARALVAARGSDVVHHDVSPDNVLIARSGSALLTGFGLPKERMHAGRPIFGTIGYIAPEQASGQGTDYRSDQYGLGAMLFRLLTGRRVFEGPNDSAILQQLFTQSPPDVRAFNAEVPESVATIIARCLVRRKEERFEDPRALLDALDHAISSVERAGVAPSAKPFEEQQRRIRLRAASLSAAAVFAAIIVPLLFTEIFSSTGRPSGRIALQDAFVGSLAVTLALTLLAALGLVRRGELPLPMSTAWLVRVQDASGAIGAAFLVAGVSLGPLAILNVLVSMIAAAVLVSWIYGILLRRTIAFLRPDRGVGRMLAVLGDPHLAEWRLVHIPLLAALASLAAMRLAFLAYFASSQSVIS
jgi:hypothetical protein